MLRFAHLGRIGLTVGTVAVLAVGLTTNAQAAPGRIRYWNAAQQEFQISNPPDGVCLTLQFHAQLLSNETTKTVSYYFDANCSNHTGDLAPGRAVAYQSPLSVKVIG
ncbi:MULTISPECIES: hypothetical protein [unclassified Streptomyces]|uniref:hypothetical protein n=1 Tax=unclassified Streptomyces TaxID=2593676 RepID=UPI00364ACBC2